MYFNPYQMYQNPYQQNVTGLNGKTVTSESEINVSEIPMDGSVAVFPRRDMQEIYCKSWNNNGTISSTVFIPRKTVNSTETAVNNKTDKLDDIISRLDRLEKAIRKEPDREFPKSYNANAAKQSPNEQQSNDSECYQNGSE